MAEALKRDGRFTDDLGYFQLVKINDKCKTECTDVIDNLGNNKFQICFPQGANMEIKDVKEVKQSLGNRNSRIPHMQQIMQSAAVE